MKSKKEILERIRTLQTDVDEGVAILEKFEKGRHLFNDLAEGDRLCQKLLHDTHALITLMWVIGEEE